MPPHGDGREYGEENYIAGAHGTIAEQLDEAFYDDRSDASDDLEKGRITFPTGIYGRDRELQLLMDIYSGLVSEAANKNNTESDNEEGAPQDTESSDNDNEEGAPQDLGIVNEKKPARESFSHKKIFKRSTWQRSFVPGATLSVDGSRVVFLSGYSGVGKSALVQEFVNQAKGKFKSSQNVRFASGKYTEQSSATAPFSAIFQVLESLESQFTNEENTSWTSNVLNEINRSTVIGSGADGNKILRSIFPILTPLLSTGKDETSSSDEHSVDPSMANRRVSKFPLNRMMSVSRRHVTQVSRVAAQNYVHPSMNAIKECTRELLTIICKALEKPLVIFLDDVHWGDEASMDVITFLLKSQELNNIMWICAYRSNEVDADHSFTKLMDIVTEARLSAETMDLFSLSQEAIIKFIADCVKREDTDNDIAELAEVVYQKTMGNIFFVKQAVEELARKNVLFYDVMCFEWKWVVSKVELENCISDDVGDTVKGKVKELSDDIQHLLIVMAHVPNTLEIPLLRALIRTGRYMFENYIITKLLEEAAVEGMLIFSVESGNYIIAHDQLRQVCIEFSGERDGHDELLLHVSQVLIAQADGSEAEWHLFVAVDLLDSLPIKLFDLIEMAKLSLRVSKIARRKGATRKEHDLLLRGLNCLKASGQEWKEYEFTLDLYNALILSEYSLGSFDKAMLAIDEVIKNGRSLDDKLHAYTHQVICKCEETSDYSQGVKDGLKVLALYGYVIHEKPSKALMMKEEVKLKMSLRNRSYSCLANLPAANVPILLLFKHVSTYAMFTSQGNILRLLAWKSIHCSHKKGIDSRLPMVIALLSVFLAKRGKILTANEMGNCALALSERFKQDKESYASIQFISTAGVVCQLQPFSCSIDRLHQCYKDLKMMGTVEVALGSMLNYCQSYFAAGLELGPLIESKLFLAEEYCREVERMSFLMSFQIYRQFVLNLRQQTDKPAELEGEAFHEKEVLDAMDGPGRSMVLRDSSSHRLQLAFIFWDEDTMAGMLDILEGYPLTDSSIARLHNRLCFAGLAAIALGRARNSDAYEKLGKDCLGYFNNLSKHGSINARPVYLFMLVLVTPSRPAFQLAIDSCKEAKFINLQAIALERYAVYLRTQSDTQLANDCITTAYWLYQDWGAHAKTLELQQTHDFLKNAKKKNERSVTSTSKSGRFAMNRFNSTFKSRSKVQE